jgi:hypothetical protein
VKQDIFRVQLESLLWMSTGRKASHITAHFQERILPERRPWGIRMTAGTWWFRREMCTG